MLIMVVIININMIIKTIDNIINVKIFITFENPKLELIILIVSSIVPPNMSINIVINAIDEMEYNAKPTVDKIFNHHPLLIFSTNL